MKNEKRIYVDSNGLVYWKSTYTKTSYNIVIIPNDSLQDDDYKGDYEKAYYDSSSNPFNGYDELLEEDLKEVPLTYIGADTISTRYLDSVYNKLLKYPHAMNPRFADCYEYILNELGLLLEERERKLIKEQNNLADTIAGVGVYLAQMYQGSTIGKVK